MKRRLGFLAVLLAVMMALAVPVSAQAPVYPNASDPTWQGYYYNNTTLSGNPALIRADADINFDWGQGSPAGQVSSDNFSVRWTKYIHVTAGTYTFETNSDDGIRLYIDNQLVIDQWVVRAATTNSISLYLTSGHHLVRIEYFEQGGLASARFRWFAQGSPPAPTPPPPSPSPGPWKADYYNNIGLSGSPVLTRNETSPNYDWGTGSPQPGVVNSDNFSARWTRTADLAAGTYTFSVTVDDGVRLYVNGHLLINAWYDQAATTYSDTIFLPGGPVPIELQYYERGGFALIKLSYTAGAAPPSPQPQPPAGGVVVDNHDPGFVRGGAVGGWRHVSGGQNGTMLWTYNNYSVQPHYNWARWYPSLHHARYEVYVFVPDLYTTTSRARYWISHAGGYTLRIVDQNASGNQWVSLGTYWFRGNNLDYVSLADVTYEPYRTRLIGFDAVKWVQR